MEGFSVNSGSVMGPRFISGQEHTGACRQVQQGARNTQAPANGAYEDSHSTVPATGRQPAPPIWQALIWQAQNACRGQAKFDIAVDPYVKVDLTSGVGLVYGAMNPFNTQKGH